MTRCWTVFASVPVRKEELLGRDWKRKMRNVGLVALQRACETAVAADAVAAEFVVVGKQARPMRGYHHFR